MKLCNDAELHCLLRVSRKVSFQMKVVGEQHVIDTQLVEQHVNDRQLALVTGTLEEFVVRTSGMFPKNVYVRNSDKIQASAIGS